MGLKMVALKGRLVSAKDKLFRLFSLLNVQGDDSSEFLPPNQAFSGAFHGQARSMANYALEADLRKTEAMLYCHIWLDRSR